MLEAKAPCALPGVPGNLKQIQATVASANSAARSQGLAHIALGKMSRNSYSIPHFIVILITVHMAMAWTGAQSLRQAYGSALFIM